MCSCEYERVQPTELIPDGVVFVKNNNTNPNLPQNQDRITDNVWITRGLGGGEIYNARVESSVAKRESPEDTEWAIGTTDDLPNLTFDTFRNTIRPREVVGKRLVLHLITDDIYLDIQFTAWSSGKAGGFAYVRSPVSDLTPSDESSSTPGNGDVQILEAADFQALIPEQPAQGDTIGFIDAFSNNGAVTYKVLTQSVDEALVINASNGAIQVANQSVFLSKSNAAVTATVRVSDSVQTEIINVSVKAVEVWSGPMRAFVKADNSNQVDSLTANVWITRGNNGGQIFNAKKESGADKQRSPIDTEWAIGTTDDMTNLVFDSFRKTVRPQNAVGKSFVLHLVTDDVYLDLKFTSWSQRQDGGFAYERTTR